MGEARAREPRPHESASIFKTVDLILGIPPLNQYDAAATDLREMFGDEPDFTPFAVAPSRSRRPIRSGAR